MACEVGKSCDRGLAEHYLLFTSTSLLLIPQILTLDVYVTKRITIERYILLHLLQQIRGL